jgi:peptidoglycan/xylan/chitin deacetylase (PgdA/CDA1 family)
MIVVVALVVAGIVIAIGSGSEPRAAPGAAGSRSAAGAAAGKGAGATGEAGAGLSGAHQPRAARTSAAQTAELNRLAALGLPIYCAGPRGNAVGFTFDDGPGPYTHYALKKLLQAHQQATFFAVGRSIEHFPGWLQRELKVAVIGDHTFTHPVLSELPQATVYSEIARTAQLIQRETGEHVRLFRPPYEARNATVDQVAKQLGMVEILWNVDSADSLGANYAGITANVEAGLHPGSIILMHENRGQTIRALTAILPELARRHLRSVTVPELLASDPPSVAQVRRGPAGCQHAVLHGAGA